MIKYPVSFFMIFGLTLFHYVLPIPLTLLELKPVTYNLLMPFETFLHHGLFLLVIIITHFFYRKITLRRNPLRSILKKTNFYKRPTDFQIWSTSLVALLSSAYFYFVYGSWENYEAKNIFVTIGKSLGVYLWMPIIIPFFKVRQVEGRLTNKAKSFIIIYSLLVGVIAVVSNWRTILYSGFVIFLLLYLIGLLYGYYELKHNFSTNKIVMMFIGFYVITGPIMDLGTAMVITRQTRYTTSSYDFFKNTFETYQDKELLRKFNAVIADNGKIDYSIKKWDEEYLSNYALNRFCNLKISDNCIYYAEKIGFANERMQNVLLDQVLSIIPGFISNSIDFKTETRGEIYQSSITDNLYSLAINDTTVKGSAIIGSMPGVGLSIFGYWYLIAIIPIFFDNLHHVRFICLRL
ncbi:hypothetical protein ACFFWB_05805 [Flavobacterium procerum]|uniref:hypothetical protein n=1 Tax=Flavobacterium procerum TaxID=1455569 RepID=UPI0035E97FFA